MSVLRSVFFVVVRLMRTLIGLLQLMKTLLIGSVKYLNLLLTFKKFKSMSKDSLRCPDEIMLENSLASKKSKVFAARQLQKWFEIDITLKIFGVELIHWHYPPSGGSSSPYIEDDDE